MVQNFISLFGVFVFVGIAWVFSTNRRKLNWHAILWGIGLQLAFGFFVFQVPAGTQLFLLLNDLVLKVIEASSAGTRFLFGPLALPPGVEGSPGFILAFQALPTIVFFSALLSLLYFVNIMPWVIRLFARIFTKLMRISGAESLCAASNLFVGVESALTIRPHLPEMTRSELCTVLTAGMATIASNVLAFYVFILKPQFPTIAGHLISATILSAPAAIVISKVIVPEEEVPRTLGLSVQPHYVRESNLFEAIITGANAGVRVIVGVAALLLAVLGLIALLDMLLGAAGEKLNTLMGTSVDWTLKGLLGYLFYPLTLMMGVPLNDAGAVAKIVGERTVATEVAGYQDLALAISKGTLADPRSIVITTYALCGFAHFASMAIFVGGTAALAPERTRALSEVAIRSLIAATLACLMTACVAGVFCTGESILTAR